MEKVMKDDNYQYVRAKFKKPSSVAVSKNYQCHTPNVKHDSLRTEDRLRKDLKYEIPDLIE